ACLPYGRRPARRGGVRRRCGPAGACDRRRLPRPRRLRRSLAPPRLGRTGTGNEMSDKDFQRALRFLSAGPADAVATGSGARVILDAGGRGSIAVEAAAARRLVAEGLARREGARIALTDA